MIAGRGRLPSRSGLVAAAALMVLGLAAAQAAEGDNPSAEALRERARQVKFPNTQLEPIEWSRLEGWAADDHAAAFATFMNSCNAILGGPPGQRDHSRHDATIYSRFERIATRSSRPLVRPFTADRPRRTMVASGAALRIN